MASTLWNIDTTHTGIHFSVRHMVVAKVRGSFTKFGGTLTLDDANPAGSSVSVSIEAASITTGVEQRDNHLRSPDFFDVEKFPAITFRSTQVAPVGKHLKVTGQLTIRGISREVVLDAEQLGIAVDPWGNTKAAFEGKTTINRSDFGLTWNQALEAGGVLVGEKIEITLEVQAAKDRSGEKAA